MIKYRKIKDSDNAVAGVVVAVLLIGLFVSALAVVQSSFVPNWMEQKEAEHMDTVENQFTQLKYAIDTLTVSENKYGLISSPITLGSKEMPYFSSARSYGNLNILPDACNITFENDETEENISLGSIRYESTNQYFLDQTYIYENGALILSQDKGSSLKVEPSFIVVSENELVFNLVKIKVIVDKVSISGYGTCPIQTKFINKEQVEIDTIQNMTIFTDYIKPWKTFFNDTLPHSDSDKLDYTITETPDGKGVNISFIEDSADGTLYPRITVNINEIEIYISKGLSK